MTAGDAADPNATRPPWLIARDLDAVAAHLDPWILAADPDHGTGHPDGPTASALPLLGTPEWVAADPATRDAAVAVYVLAALAEREPVVIAARLAAEIAAGRAAHRAAIRQAGHDVHGGDRRFWARTATNHVPHTEMARRRAQPGPIPTRRRPNRQESA